MQKLLIIVLALIIALMFLKRCGSSSTTASNLPEIPQGEAVAKASEPNLSSQRTLLLKSSSKNISIEAKSRAVNKTSITQKRSIEVVNPKMVSVNSLVYEKLTLEQQVAIYKADEFSSRLRKAVTLKSFSFSQVGTCSGSFQATVRGKDRAEYVIKISIGAGTMDQEFYTGDCLNIYSDSQLVFSAKMKDGDLSYRYMDERRCAVVARESLYIEILKDKAPSRATKMALYRKTAGGKIKFDQWLEGVPLADGASFEDFCSNSKIQ